MSGLPYHEMNLHRLVNQLIHIIVQMDKADARSEMRHGGRVNVYRIGLLLKAKDEVVAMAKKLVAGGMSERDAFLHAVMEHFTATRRMHTFLKKIDPTVEVGHGGWQWRGEEKQGYLP